MKQFKQIIIITIILCCSVGLYAQQKDNIGFSTYMDSTLNLKKDQKERLKIKIDQIIARNISGAISMYNAFVIIPQLTITDTKRTEGLVKNITVVNGELTLLVKNIYDGSIYGSTVVKLNGNNSSGKSQAIDALISSIRATDPIYTRFIRNAKTNIVDYYTNSFPTIMAKVKALVTAKQYEQAIEYLGCVPSVVPNYGEALAAIEEICTTCQSKDDTTLLQLAKIHYLKKDYNKALEVLQQIPIDSNCAADVKTLIDSVGVKLNKNL